MFVIPICYVVKPNFRVPIKHVYVMDLVFFMLLHKFYLYITSQVYSFIAHLLLFTSCVSFYCFKYFDFSNIFIFFVLLCLWLFSSLLVLLGCLLLGFLFFMFPFILYVWFYFVVSLLFIYVVIFFNYLFLMFLLSNYYSLLGAVLEIRFFEWV